MLQQARNINTLLKSKTSGNADKIDLTQNEIYENKPNKIFVKNVTRYSQKSGKTLSRILLLTGGSSANSIIKALNNNKAKVIGSEEHDFILENHLFKVVPSDFPDTIAFQTFNKQKTEMAQKKYLDFPDNKKFDYYSNSFPFPFELNFEHSENQTELFFKTVSTGNIKSGALVFLCEERDLTEFLLVGGYDSKWDEIMNYKPAENKVIVEQKKSNELSFENISDYRTFLSQTVICKRMPVGKVLNSHFNFSLAKNGGVLAADVLKINQSFETQQRFFKGKKICKELEDSYKNGKGLVLLRNHNSFNYYFALIV